MYRWLFILLSLCYALPIQAGNVLFAQANQAYHNQNYTEAANTYMRIIDDGFTDGSVYYNAGNSYYKLKKFGWAMWCYQKALQYEPNNKTIKENIKLTEFKLAQPKSNGGSVSFKDVLKSLVSFHSANRWALGMMIAFGLALLIMSLRNFFNAHPIFIPLKKLSWIIGAVYFIGTGLSYYFNHFFTNAIVITNAVAYKDKSEQGMGKFPVVEGSAVVVQSYYDGSPQRYQVTLENGDCVWVNATSVKKL